jgi:hypothetical protein
MRGATSTIRSLRELFSERRFDFPSYQRDYSWPDVVIQQLCRDLTDVFHERSGGERDPEYFLGLIVTIKPQENEGDEGQIHYVVDGQQRLTTLALLLTAIAKLSEGPIRAEIQSLLVPNGTAILATTGFRQAIADFSNAIAKPTRGRRRKSTSYMERVGEVLELVTEWLEGSFDVDDTAEDSEIAEFGLWVLEQVHVVEIVDTDPYDDQLLFDRINTRGHPLAQADAFRSRMLASQAGARKVTEKEWQLARANAAQAYDKNPSHAAIDCERKLMIAWLVAHHASTSDRSYREAEFRKIIKEPYDWAWTHFAERNAEFFQSLRQDFFSLAREIVPILTATRIYRSDLAGFFTAQLAGLPLIDVFAAAVLKRLGNKRREGDLETASCFLDAVGSRLLLCTDWCPSKAELTNLMLDAIHHASGTSGSQLRPLLNGVLASVPNRSFKPDTLPTLKTKPSVRSKQAIRYANLRMSEYLAIVLRVSEPHRGLSQAASKLPQIEHLMGDDFETYKDLYPGLVGWRDARERFGALTVLDPSENASIQTKPFAAKAKVYASSYLIAASITSAAYPGGRFKGKKLTRGLPITPMDGISLENITAREKMLCELAGEIWPIPMNFSAH